MSGAGVYPEDATESGVAAVTLPTRLPVSTPASTAPRQRRRLESLARDRETSAVRIVPGQLPTFERSYLVHELRNIAITAGILLTLIIVLAIVLR
jgi:hypothetical protein